MRHAEWGGGQEQLSILKDICRMVLLDADRLHQIVRHSQTEPEQLHSQRDNEAERRTDRLSERQTVSTWTIVLSVREIIEQTYPGRLAPRDCAVTAMIRGLLLFGTTSNNNNNNNNNNKGSIRCVSFEYSDSRKEQRINNKYYEYWMCLT